MILMYGLLIDVMLLYVSKCKYFEGGAKLLMSRVNHPVHYNSGKYECIEVMEDIFGAENVQAFCMCNAFKYIYRHMKKNGIEDVEKARWYMDKYIEIERRKES